jgi:hypothetical protein
MTKQSKSRRVTNPAPVVQQITASAGTTGKQEVERIYVEPMACDPIATVQARIGGVDGVKGRMDIDCGANVNVMAQQAIERAALQHKVKPGKTRFTQADGCEATSNGWVNTRIGLGKHYEVCARFIVKKNVDYDCLIGTTTIRRINGVVNFKEPV